MKRPVALLLPHLLAGGAERAMLDIARGLAQRGLTIHLLLVRKEGPYIELLPEGVRVVDLGARRALASLLKVVRYIRRERPSVLLTTLPETNVIAMLAGLLSARRTPVIVRRAGILTMELANGSIKQRMTVRIESHLLRSASAVIVNSLAVAKDLKRYAPKASPPIHVVHNPVVWPDHAHKAAMPVDHPWFNDGTIPVVLSVARLAPPKDVPTLLRAIAKVRETRMVRLAVLGDGPQKAHLTQLARDLRIADSVDFLEFRINPFAYMAKADVLVLSSRYEGSPNVLVQAMACGTPIIAADCPGGVRETLEDGKLGALFPVGDAGCLAAAIRQTLDAPPNAASLFAKAKEFCAAPAIGKYLEVLAEATT